MTPTALILIIIAAFAHATWNFVSKSREPSSASFFVATIAGAITMSPALIYRFGATASITPEVWLLLFTTGFFQAVYFAGLLFIAFGKI